MLRAIIPKPIQIVIDDVGWWRGNDAHAQGQPFRTGMPRDHVLADYQALVHLGKSLGMRPQAAFVLCEWDRHNILRKLPESTWLGHDWDNSAIPAPVLDETAAFLAANRAHFELVLHGIGHEFWENGRMSRAEWFDDDGNLRPQARQHLDFYAMLMAANNLGPFPESFVPCAFRYRFGAADGGLARILAEYGISSMSSPFSTMHFSREPESPAFGFDQGLMTIDRGPDLRKWNDVGSAPGPEETLQSPVCGMHWPAILHAEPERNLEAVARWLPFFQRHDRMPEWTLAANTGMFCTQLAHQAFTVTADSVVLDFSAFNSLSWRHFTAELTLKMVSGLPVSFSSADAEICTCDCQPQDGGIIYTLKLQLRLPGRHARIRWSRTLP